MEPTNDHELEIAKIADQMSMEGRLDLSVIDKMIAVLRFTTSMADRDFLIRYLRWRIRTPVMK